MKYLKKKKKPNMVVPILLLLLMAVVVILLCKNGKDNGNNIVPQQGATEAILESTEATTAAAEIEIEKPVVREYDVVELVDGEIQTPYGTLSYPEGLADFLLIINTSQQPYTLEFYAVMEEKQELRLFDISLGEGSGSNMGMVTTPEGEIPLNVTIYALTTDETWSENEIATAYAMQDAVNEILAQMNPSAEDVQTEGSVITHQPDEAGTINNLEIETPFGTVYYPARWADTVGYECDDSQEDVYKVHFYSRMDGVEDQKLFSIYFGGDEGEQLGAVMSNEGIPVSVNLLMGQLQLEGLNEDDIARLFKMQEACNDLVERLPLLQ